MPLEILIIYIIYISFLSPFFKFVMTPVLKSITYEKTELELEFGGYLDGGRLVWKAHSAR